MNQRYDRGKSRTRLSEDFFYFCRQKFAADEGFENESVSYFRGIGIALTQIAVRELKAFGKRAAQWCAWIALCIG